jgi:hypothetical protein
LQTRGPGWRDEEAAEGAIREDRIELIFDATAARGRLCQETSTYARVRFNCR